MKRCNEIVLDTSFNTIKILIRKTLILQSIYIFFLLILVSAIGCKSDEITEPEESGASLSGIVREAGTESPVSGATVTVGNMSTTTAQDGRFELQSVPISPSITIQVSLTEFEPYKKDITVDKGTNNHDIFIVRRGTYFTYDEFIAYLLPGTSAFSGVIFLLPGAGMDLRPFIRGLESDPGAVDFRQQILVLAATYNLAVIGCSNNLYTSASMNYRSERMLAALEQFATLSAHPELEQAPLLLFGYSAGGCTAYAFAVQNSDRIIGFISYKLGCGSSSISVDAGEARSVPAYFWIGELDTPNRIAISTEIFELNRGFAAPFAVAVEPDAGHELGDIELLINWMDVVLTSRLPENVTLGMPVTLRPIDETSGWLGNRSSFAIAKYECYDQDKLQASWFPSEQTARDWQAMVSKQAINTVIECGNN